MLSIIIVGWNCVHDIGACLDSLFQHPPSGSFEVIYVDSGSVDGSLAHVRRSFPSVRTLANESNVGFQRGNNQGLAVATGDELLLLNPDTRVTPGSLDALFGFLRQHPEAGAASPLCLFPDGRVQWSIAPFPSLAIIRQWFWTTHPVVARLCGHHPPAPRSLTSPQTQEQAYAYGACLAVKRQVATAVGPMDERFFLAGGDVAWSREIVRHGWKVYYVAEAAIVHRASVSRQRRPWTSTIDWILAHRRLLYQYQGLAAGLLGDLVFSTHLVLSIPRVVHAGIRRDDARAGKPSAS